MKINGSLLIATLVVLLTSCNTGNQNNPNSKDSSTITDSANTVKLQLVTRNVHFPVEVKPAPDATHRLFIAETRGQILILKNGILSPTPFLDISSKLEQKDSAPDVRVMYSMVFSPQFEQNRKFYVCYNAPTKIDSNTSKLVVSEFTANAGNTDIADLGSERRVFEVEGHFIFRDPCEMMFGPDGYLYISVGDNGTPMKLRKAEDLNSYQGKLLRIDVSTLPYKVPADNPFVLTKNARPEIWAYGLRRLWRFTYDKETKTFIGGDIGDKLREEVDTLTKGGNYGWPFIEGDSVRVGNDSLTGKKFITPIAAYGHKDGICVIGGNIYRGKEIAYLQGRYFFADFNGSLFTLSKNKMGSWIRQQLTILNKSKDPFLINSINVDENNEIYLCGVLNTDAGTKGAVFKLVKAF